MKLSQQLLTEISQIIRDIEDKFPELQKYLDENPMTLPNETDNDAGMDDKSLREYLNSLKELVKTYEQEH